jgi:hypothetical protein
MPTHRLPALLLQHKKWTADEVAALLAGLKKHGLPAYLTLGQDEARLALLQPQL